MSTDINARSLSSWDDAWAAGSTGWRTLENTAIPPFAENLRFAEEAIGEKLVVPGRRALVPLCGDSSVLPFLAREGLTVTGVEGSAKAVRALQEKLRQESPEVQARIHVVEGNFFEFLPGAPAHLESAARDVETYDLIYDRAAFIAIDPSDRPKYASVLAAWTRPSAVCFFEGIEREGDAEHNARGPPFHFPVEAMHKNFAASHWKPIVDTTHRVPVPAQKMSFWRAVLRRL